MRRTAVLIIIGVALAGAAACSTSSSSKSSKATAASRSATGSPAPGNATGKPRIDLTQAKRSEKEVIHTAEVSMQAKDVNEALGKATALVERAGGDLFSSDADLGDPKSAHVRAVFKVPPEQFGRVMSALSSVGKITNSQTSTEDVTGQVVDLDARLAAARTGVTRLRDLLAHSGNVTDLLQVEQALAQRESDVESLDGQLAALRSRVDAATITVALSPAPVATAAAPSHDIPGFLAGLRTGVAALVNSALVGGTALGFLLPFLVVIGVFGVPALRIARRRRGGATA
jgi:uncharacterized protein DUF4349